MKIAGNKNEKKGTSKLLPLIGGCACLVCVVAVVILVVSLTGRNGDSVEPSDSRAVSGDIVDDQSLNGEIVKVDDDKIEAPQSQSTEEVPDDDRFNNPIVYTTADEGDESLIQLVRNTIMSANAQIYHACEVGEGERASIMIDAIDNANFNGQLEGKFESLDDSFTLEDHDDWTFLDIAGGVSNIMLHEGDLQNDELVKNDVLKWFVAKGVYRFEVEDDSFTSVSKVNDVEFVDVAVGSLDVNFVVNFGYKEKNWVALIGKTDDLYRVLDIVEEDNIYLVMKEKKKEEVVVKDDKDKDKDKNKIDPNDPNYGWPGYEGPKEGYVFSRGTGTYFEESNGTGPINLDPDFLGFDHSPCVYDENGKCIAHEHWGY